MDPQCTRMLFSVHVSEPVKFERLSLLDLRTSTGNCHIQKSKKNAYSSTGNLYKITTHNRKSYDKTTYDGINRSGNARESS